MVGISADVCVTLAAMSRNQDADVVLNNTVAVTAELQHGRRGLSP